MSRSVLDFVVFFFFFMPALLCGIHFPSPVVFGFMIVHFPGRILLGFGGFVFLILPFFDLCGSFYLFCCYCEGPFSSECRSRLCVVRFPYCAILTV